MGRREPPRTEEGLYVLHDLRSVDWDAWRAATDRDREAALAEGVAFLEDHAAVEEGDTAAFSVLGHKADLLILHLRPTLAELDTAEREFEGCALSEFTDRASSYLSVTEASGYTEAAADYFDPDVEADPGLRRYMDSRLYPDLPETEFVSFYPMSKRRDPEYNWYDLPFEERRELMAAHGEIGRDYAGKVTQIISGSVGLDDHEWGVTLFADDMTDIKRLLTEMRFDPSSSKYAEFGRFYTGRRFAPSQLEAFLAGESVSTATGGGVDTDLAEEFGRLGVEVDAPEGAHGLVLRSDADVETVREEVDGLRGNFEHYDSHVLTEVRGDGDETAVLSVWETERAADTARGFLEELPGVREVTAGALADEEVEPEETGEADTDDIRGELADLDIYAGKPHGEDVYAMVLYSEADPDTLAPEVEDLAEGFDRYDTHVKTATYQAKDGDRSAVVSIWETADAADTAGGFLADLPGIVARAGRGPAEETSGEERPASRAGEESGFGTMGMFYTVEPDHREEFVEKFDTVGGLLEEMDGHHETDLMVNVADENDMFIASQWRSKEDAMAFFRSDAFRDTVQWGRDVLADRPRHVFLA
ncbi:heme-binding protein [Halalkalicoccus sp. NIPERK01]|uniref:heme-binding protein n=1 Tax=Halalkalicoccus sp. NIPERK01 TaxID=3053469 RepID=UPI00256ED976|nr:heme-binding protein [Halalkalicoccus sp. NIPERK01]MDL5362363.1 heme-binding protein [Halalkalicoccus sp. NIPERK01]